MGPILPSGTSNTLKLLGINRQFLKVIFASVCNRKLTLHVVSNAFIRLLTGTRPGCYACLFSLSARMLAAKITVFSPYATQCSYA